MSGMIRMDETAELVRRDVFDAVSGRFQKAFVERDDAFLGKARAPAGFHITNTQRGHLYAVFLKGRINLLHDLAEHFSALPVQIVQDESFSECFIPQLFHMQEQIYAIRGTRSFCATGLSSSSRISARSCGGSCCYMRSVTTSCTGISPMRSGSFRSSICTGMCWSTRQTSLRHRSR